MIKRIPLSFTTIQNENLKNKFKNSNDPVVLSDPNSYISDRVKRNSANAGVWAILSDKENEKVVAICKPNLELTKKYNFDQENWEKAFFVWKSPTRYVGPINPTITFSPIISELKNLGRGAFFTSEDGNFPKTWDFPNWTHRESGIPWGEPGASGILDLDLSNTFSTELLSDETRESAEFRVEIPLLVFQGLLDGSYSGLRISMLEDEEAGKCVNPLQFSNDLIRNYTTLPYIQLESTEDQFLDRTGNFLPWEKNNLSISFSVSGIPKFPIEISTSSELRMRIKAVVSLLYKRYELDIFQTELIDIELEQCILKTVAELDQAFLDKEVKEIFVDEGFLVDQPGVTIPDYEDPGFYDAWHDPLNREFRESQPVLNALGSTTLREAIINGSKTFKIDLFNVWEHKEGTQTDEIWRELGKREIRVSDLDEFGSFVGKFDGEVYPRVTTVGLRRRFLSGEGPQKVVVFIDDRPPQQMANATLRRNANKRYSGLYEDLAWGIVSGSQINPGNWIVEPSESTLLSHDGNYHYFTFDVEALPLGPLKFEFVRLSNNSLVRQINTVTFVVDSV